MHIDSTYASKATGCFIGAAIGDAMGGPVECQHYKRIDRVFPDFDDFLPYRKPPGLIDLHPGYALTDTPGSITDDTFIRADLATYLLTTPPDIWRASTFAPWLLKHADFSNWWDVAVRVLERIQAGELQPETSGIEHVQGGGGGWWQPIAMLYGGEVSAAVALTRDLCRIWKAPLEQDILSAVVAGQAAAFLPGASVDSVVDAVIDQAGPLASKLFTRAVEIAHAATSRDQLYEQLYAHCLVTECSNAVDGPLPPHVEPDDYNDGFYSGILFAEQQPLALAYFVYGQGDPLRTVLTAVKGGRDADSIATNTASWLGALYGMDVWPKHWAEQVQAANSERLVLLGMAADLIKRATSLRRGDA